MVWERVGWGCDAGVRWGAWRGRGCGGVRGAGGWCGRVEWACDGARGVGVWRGACGGGEKFEGARLTG